MHGHPEGQMVDEMIDCLKVYLLTRDIKKYYVDIDSDVDQSLHLNYDIPVWLQDSDIKRRLEDFQGSHKYIVRVIESDRRRFNKISDMAQDFELSLQILYRDGLTKDFWPAWLKEV